VHFRPARLEDVDAVVDLVDSAYRGERSRAGWTTEAGLIGGQRTDATEVSELICRPGSLVLLAEQDGAVVACCHLEQRPPGTAYFGMFAVRPDRQGSGVGKIVIAEARRAAASLGCARMKMTVIRQRPELIAWYRRLGFEPTGETEPFPYGDERYGLPKRDDLEFVVLVGSTDEDPPGGG
jgi:ribosomal protein S18 acetylase RimI-like enzyme